MSDLEIAVKLRYLAKKMTYLPFEAECACFDIQSGIGVITARKSDPISLVGIPERRFDSIKAFGDKINVFFKSSAFEET